LVLPDCRAVLFLSVLFLFSTIAAAHHPFAITPFVALGIPSNNYIYFAHSAAGTNQREYVFGSSFGRNLEPVGHMCKGCMRFLYPEKIRGIRTYRSRLDWEVGCFAAQALCPQGAGRLADRSLRLGDG
jgi:hypothetical protein